MAGSRTVSALYPLSLLSSALLPVLTNANSCPVLRLLGNGFLPWASSKAWGRAIVERRRNFSPRRKTQLDAPELLRPCGWKRPVGGGRNSLCTVTCERRTPGVTAKTGPGGRRPNQEASGSNPIWTDVGRSMHVHGLERKCLRQPRLHVCIQGLLSLCYDARHALELFKWPQTVARNLILRLPS